MERSLGLIVSFVVVVLLLCVPLSSGDSAGNLTVNRLAPVTKDLCADVIQRYRHYSCAQHIVQTTDGYKLGLHRVSSYEGSLRETRHPAVLLLHGLFVAGDSWFLDSVNQSLGYILTDSGFDVWVGNVRGTRWSHGHISLSERDKEFWDWSWEDLAIYDFSAMLHHVNTVTNSKIFVVGHSQGTIISLAAFTETDIVNMVAGAALLAPISYLGHVSSPLVLRMVGMHLDEVIRALGIHQLNFWRFIIRGPLLPSFNDTAVQLIDSLCDGHVDCNDMLSALTGPNCCMNMSRVDFYFDYEPHPSSVKNLNHLFQMIRKGTFSKYDYGKFKNLKKYGHFKPPVFDLSCIPKSLPLWMGYGGNDALADTIDLQQTLNELQSTPEMLYLENYGHVDFVLSTSAKTDIYDNMIRFFWSLSGRSSSF